MSDMNVNVNIQTQGTWGASTADMAPVVSNNSVFDSINFGSGIKVDVQYTQDSSRPKLQTPEPSTWKFADGPPPQEFSPSPEHAFLLNAQAALDKLPLNPEQKKQLAMALLLGTPPQDPALAGFYGQLEENVMNQLSEQYPELGQNLKLKDVKSSTQEALNQKYTESFEGQLDKLAKELGLSKEQVARLKFGFFNPDLADPKDKELLAKLETEALRQVQRENGLPTNYTPSPTTSDFMPKLFAEIDAQVMDALSNLPEPQKQQATYLYYHPEANFPDKASLQALLTQVLGSSLTSIRAEFGIPSSVTLSPLTASFDMILNGNFQENFFNLLHNQSPPLSKQEIQDILDILAGKSPGDGALKAKLDAIFNQAIALTKSQNALPADWKPQITNSELANVSTATLQAWSIKSQVSERVNILSTLVSQMPESPEKGSYADMLKIVTDALSTLREMIYLMESKDSSIGSKLSLMQKDATLNKLAAYERKLHQIEHKKKKVGKLEPLMNMTKIFSSIMLIGAALCANPMFWPITLGLAGAMVASQFTKTDYVEKMFKGVEMLTENIAGKMGLPPTAQEVFAKMARYAVLVGICSISGIMFGMTFFFQQGKVMDSIAKLAGANEMQASIVSSSVEVATQFVVMIAMFAVITVITLGVGSAFAAGGLVAGITKGIGDASMKVSSETIKAVLQTIAKAIEAFVRFIEQALEKLPSLLRPQIMNLPSTMMTATQTSVSVTSSAASMMVHLTNSKIALAKGDMESYETEMQAFIKIIKEIADHIFNGLGGFTDQLQSLGEQSQNMWDSRSATATNVATSV